MYDSHLSFCQLPIVKPALTKMSCRTGFAEKATRRKSRPPDDQPILVQLFKVFYDIYDPCFQTNEPGNVLKQKTKYITDPSFHSSSGLIPGTSNSRRPLLFGRGAKASYVRNDFDNLLRDAETINYQ